jgi:HPt (histidine-containing phosphotransfer) domain-containing protein
MGSINQWPQLGVPGGPDDAFEELRMSYRDRLRSDRTQLTTLRNRLGGPGGETVPLYEAIRRIAHGMAGAAAVFKVSDVFDASSTLEQSVSLASTAHGGNPAMTVPAALDRLIELLLAEYP